MTSSRQSLQDLFVLMERSLTKLTPADSNRWTTIHVLCVIDNIGRLQEEE